MFLKLNKYIRLSPENPCLNTPENCLKMGNFKFFKRNFKRSASENPQKFQKNKKKYSIQEVEINV